MVGAGLKDGSQLQPGDHVLVRCSQSNWLRGLIRRHADSGVRVWLVVSQTLVCIPPELVSTHLVRWEDHASGGNRDFPVRVRCVRPSHLSHRNLYERVEIVSYRRYLDEAVGDSSDSGQQKDSVGPNEVENINSLLPTRPGSGATGLSCKESEGLKLLREKNPLCCGILDGNTQSPASKKKIDDDSVFAEKAICSSYGSDRSEEEEYITAYDIVKDPKDEKSMNESRAQLFKKFMARRAMLDQASAQRDRNPVSSGTQNGLGPRSAKVCLDSKHDDTSQVTMTGLMQNLASNFADGSHVSDPCANKDAFQPVSSGTDSFDDKCYHSDSRSRSGLFSMVESGKKDEFETIFASPENWGKHSRKPPSLSMVPITQDCS